MSLYNILKKLTLSTKVTLDKAHYQLLMLPCRSLQFLKSKESLMMPSSMSKLLQTLMEVSMVMTVKLQ